MPKKSPSVGPLSSRQSLAPPAPPTCSKPGCRLPAEPDKFFCLIHN